MATYGQAYYKTLQMVNQQYLGLSNLTSLQHIQNKINCYQNFHSQPHEYYQCFTNIEKIRQNQYKQLTNSYNLVEDDYKLCREACKSIDKNQQNTCDNKCNTNFTKSVKTLYDTFYKNKVGHRKQFKKVYK